MPTEQLELGNPHIIAIALEKLGGALASVDLEDLAIEVFAIAPTRFCWKKYPDRIDLRIVHYALQSATRLDPPLVDGDMKKGYMLTPQGQEWVMNYVEIGPGDLVQIFRKDSQQELSMLEISRLRKSIAFNKWMRSQKSEITNRDFQEFTRVNEYFPAAVKEQKFLRLKNIVKGDKDLEKLLKFLLKKFEGA